MDSLNYSITDIYKWGEVKASPLQNWVFECFPCIMCLQIACSPCAALAPFRHSVSWSIFLQSKDLQLG